MGHGFSLYWFDFLINNLEKLIIDICSRKSNFVLMISDFNAKSWKWSINDTTTREEAQPETITSIYGMKKLQRQLKFCNDLLAV